MIEIIGFGIVAGVCAMAVSSEDSEDRQIAKKEHDPSEGEFVKRVKTTPYPYPED